MNFLCNENYVHSLDKTKEIIKIFIYKYLYLYGTVRIFVVIATLYGQKYVDICPSLS